MKGILMAFLLAALIIWLTPISVVTRSTWRVSCYTTPEHVAGFLNTLGEVRSVEAKLLTQATAIWNGGRLVGTFCVVHR